MMNWDHVRILRVHAIVMHPIMKCLEAKGKLHIIPNNLDEFEILSDDRVYAKVATPFLRWFNDSNLRSLTVHGMWVEDAVPTLKLEELILSDVVLRHKALRNFLAANPMLQKIVADCDIENISRAANKTFCLSRLTHLGVSREATKLFRHIATPSLEVHISRSIHLDVYMLLEGLLRNPIMLTELSIIQSGVTVTPFLRFPRETSSLKSLQLSNINAYQLDLVVSVVNP
jgi:hypothetical protein